jgi:hypothetical protein
VEAAPPIIGWSGEKGAFVGTDQVRAWAQIPLATATGVHLKTEGRNTVLFVQDELSMDDFAKYANNGFAATKALLAAAADTIVLPSVTTEAETLQQVLAARGQVVVNDVTSALEAIKASKKVLVVVPLAPVSGAADKVAALAKNDLRMSQVYATLSAADPSAVALITATSESTASYGAKSLAAAPVNSEQLVVEYSAHSRSRRQDEPVVQPIHRNASKSSRSCRYWPVRIRPDGSTTQQGGKTCKPGHQFGETQKTEYFSIPILEGVVVMAGIVVPMLCYGVFFLMSLQTNSMYPSVDDANILVSTANE